MCTSESVRAAESESDSRYWRSVGLGFPTPKEAKEGEGVGESDADGCLARFDEETFPPKTKL